MFAVCHRSHTFVIKLMKHEKDIAADMSSVTSSPNLNIVELDPEGAGLLLSIRYKLTVWRKVSRDLCPKQKLSPQLVLGGQFV